MSLGDIFSSKGIEKFKRNVKIDEVETELPSSSRTANKSDDSTNDTQNPLNNRNKKRKRSSIEKSEVVDSQEMNEVSNDKGHNVDDDCTIFVGNLSVEETVKSIKSIFSDCGEIVSVRTRSLPVLGTAVDDKGNQNLVKKVCANSKLLGNQKGSFNAYVVFKKKESVSVALTLNNEVVNGRHIRVDSAKPNVFEPKRSVFIGNLPFYADEEDIRNHFASSLPNGHDDIEGIRIVRDPESLIGKGIGYLLLRDVDAVSAALQLNEASF